jgi:hypothetical protein
VEGPRLDDAVLAEAGQRTALRVVRKRLDDVAGEVEGIGNLPAAVDEGRTEGELERRERNLGVAVTASTDTKTFHGLSIIDAKW